MSHALNMVASFYDALDKNKIKTVNQNGVVKMTNRQNLLRVSQNMHQRLNLDCPVYDLSDGVAYKACVDDMNSGGLPKDFMTSVKTDLLRENGFAVIYHNFFSFHFYNYEKVEWFELFFEYINGNWYVYPDESVEARHGIFHKDFMFIVHYLLMRDVAIDYHPVDRAYQQSRNRRVNARLKTLPDVHYLKLSDIQTVIMRETERQKNQGLWQQVEHFRSGYQKILKSGKLINVRGYRAGSRKSNAITILAA